ncbi:hypothetical protein ACFX5U_05240 [Sphingobacterium sp. SG20118]|uniref:hypothetical protein n=1 Tax=Sphingobacterium sp. SG20118 TaxID=3367156 RepID=UPI0037DFC80E
MNKRIIFIGLFALQGTVLFAQKQPLNHTVYDGWQSLNASEISASGKYISYQILPQEGDGVFYLKDNINKALLSLPRGYNASMTNDETHVVSLIKPKFDDTRQAKIKKKKADDMPKDSLAIYTIATGHLLKFADVKSYKMAEEGSAHFSFLTDSKTTPSDTTAGKSKKISKISTLHLFDFVTGDTVNFQHVDQYAFNRLGSKLVFTKKAEAKDSTSTIAGVYLYDLTNKALKKITNGRGNL